MFYFPLALGYRLLKALITDEGTCEVLMFVLELLPDKSSSLEQVLLMERVAISRINNNFFMF
jgi:hypothetical protein